MSTHCGVNPLDDLRDRLVRAEQQLLLAASDAGGVNEKEYLRLEGKRQGVALALSYLEDCRRQAVES